MAIPTGWIDTGTLISHSGSITIQIAATEAGEAIRVGQAAASIYVGLEVATFPTSTCANGWHTAPLINLYTRKFSEAFGARTVEASAAGPACPQPYLSVVASRSVTGLKLVAAVDVNSTTGVSRLRSRLWADGGTVDTLTVGSKSITISHSGEFITAPSLVISHEPVITLGPVPADFVNGVVLAGNQWNGESDVTAYDNYPLRAVAFPGTSAAVWTFTSRPPLHYRVDADVRDAAGVAPAGMVTAGQASVANPGVQDITHWRWTETLGNVPVFGRLSGDWSADGVALDVGEEVVPLRQIKPKSPQNAPQSWTPATFEVSSPLSVLGLVGSFTGTGAVILSGFGNRTWAVSGVASVSQTLVASYPSANGYMTTKHVAGEDVWGWGLYAYLEVDLTAPANGDLTLTLTWVAAGASPMSADKTYTLPVTSGTHTYRVDLLFPNEGGPWYAERVSVVKFAGLQNGTYTLNNLELVAVEDAYVKLHARGNYSGLTISQDGSFAIGWWSDNPFIGAGPARQKDDESGLFDSGAGADTSAGGCVRMDSTLQAMVVEWARMEGITTTYDASQIDADLTDGTNVCGTVNELVATPLTYTARWYHTQMTLRAAANEAVDLAASLYLDGGADLCAAPAGTFVLPFRHVLGMVLEAQCKDSVTSQRAAAGSPVFARRSTTGAPTPSDTLMASGVTDASGFASVAIRDGTVGGVEMTVALLGS